MTVMNFVKLVIDPEIRKYFKKKHYASQSDSKFLIYGIDKYFMGPFPNSFGNIYVLVVVNYVSKWVEDKACRTNNHKVVVQFLKENVFAQFGTPCAIICDGGKKHFCNQVFQKLMLNYSVILKIATIYHPQTSGQVKIYNRAIKKILEKTVNPTRNDWVLKTK